MNEQTRKVLDNVEMLKQLGIDDALKHFSERIALAAAALTREIYDAAMLREEGMIHVLFPEAASPEYRNQIRQLARRAVDEAERQADGSYKCPYCLREFPGRQEFEGHALIEFYRLARKEDITVERAKRGREAAANSET